MTADDYIMSVVQKHKLPQQIDLETQLAVVNPLKRFIKEWAGNCFCDVKISGSRAKGTAIDIATDLDLFISLSSTTNNTLKEIYNSLYDDVIKKGIKARKQNVSIGVLYEGVKVDLVPAKRQNQYGNDHSLYRSKLDSWTKTNIDKHISDVINSGRINEIIALKVWRENHKLEFPSILLETVTIDALKGHSKASVARNIYYMFEYIRDNICTEYVLDPANSNNVISNDLSLEEKRLIANQARNSLSEKYWEDILK